MGTQRCQKQRHSPAAEALNVLSNDLFWPFEAGLALFSIGIGLAILNTAALPKWLGWVALVIGVVGVTPVGFFGFWVIMIWSVVVSILVFRRSDTRTTAPQELATSPATQP